MYRNGEHYTAPTEGTAIANVMAEMRKARRRDNSRSLIAAKRRAPAKVKHDEAVQKKALEKKEADSRFVLAWATSNTTYRPAKARKH